MPALPIFNVISQMNFTYIVVSVSFGSGKDASYMRKRVVRWKHGTKRRVTWLDCSGEVEINEPFMEVGVGAARYGDLNSDIPSCISKFSYTDGHEPNDAFSHVRRIFTRSKTDWDYNISKMHLRYNVEYWKGGHGVKFLKITCLLYDHLPCCQKGIWCGGGDNFESG